MKTRLILIRHAEAEGNFLRIFHGITDSSITDKGHLQAQKVAHRLKEANIDILYSSTAQRAKQTAKYISDVIGLPINISDNLKEINGGDWEGQKWEDLPTKWPNQFDTWENMPHVHSMPNGETMEQFHNRLVVEIKHIISKNEGKVICIVTHGTAIRALLCYFTGCGLESMVDIEWCDNTSITTVDFYNHDQISNFEIICRGDDFHLDNDGLKSAWW